MNLINNSFKLLKKSSIFIALFAVLWLGACTLDSNDQATSIDETIPVEDYSGTIPAAIIWDGSGQAGNSSLNIKNITQRTVTLTPNESLQAFTDYYDTIGVKVGSYTPSKFEYFINDICLYNDTVVVELDNPLSPDSEFDTTPHLADFTSDVVLTPPKEIPAGIYTGMVFFFQTGNETLYIGAVDNPPQYQVQQTSVIEVTIPGYGNIWPDELNLGSDKYAFEPDFVDVGKKLIGTNPIQYFFYMTNTENRAIIPGQTGHPTSWSSLDEDSGDMPSHGLFTNFSALFSSFDGIDIPVNAQKVNFIVSWDLNGIIEVYDNNTSGDISDDIVVLAKNFWERFQLLAEVEM